MFTKADRNILRIEIPEGAEPGPRVYQAERNLVEHVRQGYKKPDFVPGWEWESWVREAEELAEEYPA